MSYRGTSSDDHALKEQNLDAEIMKFNREKRKFESDKRAFKRQQESENRRLAQQNQLFQMKWKLLEDEVKKLADERAKLEEQKNSYERERRFEEAGRTDISIQLVRGEMFFAGVTSELALKKRYKDLIKIYHPDNVSGDTNTVQEINREYDQLRGRLEW